MSDLTPPLPPAGAPGSGPAGGPSGGPSGSPGRKPGRGLRAALILSLMVNLLVIGVLVGGAIRMARIEPFLPGQPDVRALWMALPDSARADLRMMSRDHGFPGEPGPRPSREERRARAAEMNARLVASLRAEPFDAAAFTQLLSGDREVIEQRLDAAHAAFAAQVAGLDAGERAAMAERLEEALARPRRR